HRHPRDQALRRAGHRGADLGRDRKAAVRDARLSIRARGGSNILSLPRRRPGSIPEILIPTVGGVWLPSCVLRWRRQLRMGPGLRRDSEIERWGRNLGPQASFSPSSSSGLTRGPAMQPERQGRTLPTHLSYFKETPQMAGSSPAMTRRRDRASLIADSRGTGLRPRPDVKHGSGIALPLARAHPIFAAMSPLRLAWLGTCI